MLRAVLLVAWCGLASAQPVRLTVTVPIVVHSVDERIFGQSVSEGFWSGDPGLMQALTALRPPILRWSPENWKTGASTADRFLALAQKLGSQPVIAVPSTFTDEEARELLRYCDRHQVKHVDRGGLVTEWHATSALDAAEALIGLQREGKAGMAAPAPGTVIDFDQRPWKATPVYAAMKLIREHTGIDVLQIDGSEMVATRSPDGRTICLQVVNRKPAAVDFEVNLRGDFPLLSAAMEVLSNKDLRPAPTPIQHAGMTARFRLPASSIGVITLAR
jgi:hypothetical protein